MIENNYNLVITNICNKVNDFNFKETAMPYISLNLLGSLGYSNVFQSDNKV